MEHAQNMHQWQPSVDCSLPSGSTSKLLDLLSSPQLSVARLQAEIPMGSSFEAPLPVQSNFDRESPLSMSYSALETQLGLRNFPDQYSMGTFQPQLPAAHFRDQTQFQENFQSHRITLGNLHSSLVPMKNLQAFSSFGYLDPPPLLSPCFFNSRPAGPTATQLDSTSPPYTQSSEPSTALPEVEFPSQPQYLSPEPDQNQLRGFRTKDHDEDHHGAAHGLGQICHQNNPCSTSTGGNTLNQYAYQNSTLTSSFYEQQPKLSLDIMRSDHEPLQTRLNFTGTAWNQFAVQCSRSSYYEQPQSKSAVELEVSVIPRQATLEVISKGTRGLCSREGANMQLQSSPDSFPYDQGMPFSKLEAYRILEPSMSHLPWPIATVEGESGTCIVPLSSLPSRSRKSTGAQIRAGVAKGKQERPKRVLDPSDVDVPTATAGRSKTIGAKRSREGQRPAVDASRRKDPENSRGRSKRPRKDAASLNLGEPSSPEQSCRRLHIAVERKRRQQMNEYFDTLKELLPNSYLQKMDQASIVLSTVEFLRSLEHKLQDLKEMRRRQLYAHAEVLNSQGIPIPSSLFSTLENPRPRREISSKPSRRTKQVHAKLTTKLADVEVILGSTAEVIVITSRRAEAHQTTHLINALESLYLTVLEASIRTDVDESKVTFEFQVGVEQKCRMSAYDIASNLLQCFSFIDTVQGLPYGQQLQSD